MYIATATREVVRTSAAIEIALQALATEVVASLAEMCGVDAHTLHADLDHALLPADNLDHAIVSVQGTATAP